ncbi:MAG: transcriptional repressor [Bacteroidales bacterium]|uniref:Fur family transcriptional regulator n=1 Tax=Porphyromonas sp. TaxID=1924944 RepID=UPI002979C12A|nr:transcriptional repressor [Porphyromonas sp.]MDD7438371.1 transcriptional repressor [Bacteroidales bacterium]MDY3067997.1 transcriptional repressor [Porphyromonas sp.]
MDKERLSKLLDHFGVRITPVRYLLYKALERETTAVSLTDLETELKTVDKSSIFRNLQLFLEVGLIHQIQDGSGVAKYAVNQPHGHSHAHFCCEACGETICLDELSLNLHELPLQKGYKADSFTLLIKGICPHCKK